MEAAKLNKRMSVNKSKLKKTIKNVLCRPDPVLWPVVPDEQSADLFKILEKSRTDIPVFTKLHWNHLKTIPKEKRPKPPKLKKVEDLIFGISHCARTIPTGECKAVILHAEIEPQILVHHIIDACKSFSIPFICLKDLKGKCLEYFGFSTCCLGIKNSMEELILSIKNNSKILEKPLKVIEKESKVISDKRDTIKSLDENIEKPKNTFTYLYRNSNESRVFIPPSSESPTKGTKDFKGENFINVVKESSQNKMEYKNMIIKRIQQNPNRKRKK